MQMLSIKNTGKASCFLFEGRVRSLRRTWTTTGHLHPASKFGPTVEEVQKASDEVLARWFFIEPFKMVVTLCNAYLAFKPAMITKFLFGGLTLPSVVLQNGSVAFASSIEKDERERK